MDILILFIITLVAWLILQAIRIFSGRLPISAEIQNLFLRYPPFGFLVGLVLGLLLGHWFWPVNI
jgi:hypothetical protein